MSKQIEHITIESSPFKKFLVHGVFIMVLVGGMLAFATTMHEIRNYYHPWIFVVSTGALGLIMGIFISRKIRPFVILNSQMNSDFFAWTIFFSLGLFGCFMMLGHSLNTRISYLNYCADPIVMAKEFSDAAYRRPERNFLVVNVDGQERKLRCSRDYWHEKSVGHSISVHFYKSPIGFDFLILPEDN